jgi:hypothetical protein
VINPGLGYTGSIGASGAGHGGSAGRGHGNILLHCQKKGEGMVGLSKPSILRAVDVNVIPGSVTGSLIM